MLLARAPAPAAHAGRARDARTSRIERGAQLVQHLLQPAQRQRDVGEVAGIGAPELAQMARSRGQQIQIQGLDRRATLVQPSMKA